jgi:hypothetical protein
MATLLMIEFPDLASDLQAPQMTGSVYRQLDCFATFTRRALHANHRQVLRHCFEVADSLRRHADHYLSAAIANVYWPGLHLDSSRQDAQLAQQLMPPSLYQAYCHSRTWV